jgi:hypothetical protein
VSQALEETVSDGEFYACDVYLLDTQTGERAVYRSEHEGDDPDSPGTFGDYPWRDGNFSCDCNRGLFFARAKGEDPEWNAFACGDGRYRVEKIVRVSDGQQVYSEDA